MAIGVLAMSVSERERLKLAARVSEGLILQRVAGERPGICVRQVKRLVRMYQERGDAGLLLRQRGAMRTPKGFRPAHPNPPKRARITGQIVRYLNRTYRLLPTLLLRALTAVLDRKLT